MAKVLDVLQEVLIEIHPWYHERLRLYSELRSAIKSRPAGENSQDFAVLVPGTGFEPAHRKAYAPKAYVSTNSTIRA